MPEFGAAASKSQRSGGALSLSRTRDKLVPVAKGESYFLEKEAGPETLPEQIAARSGGVASMDWAPRSRGPETLIDDSPAQLFEIGKRFRMAATRPVA